MSTHSQSAFNLLPVPHGSEHSRTIFCTHACTYWAWALAFFFLSFTVWVVGYKITDGHTTQFSWSFRELPCTSHCIYISLLQHSLPERLGSTTTSGEHPTIICLIREVGEHRTCMATVCRGLAMMHSSRLGARAPTLLKLSRRPLMDSAQDWSTHYLLEEAYLVKDDETF